MSQMSHVVYYCALSIVCYFMFMLIEGTRIHWLSMNTANDRKESQCHVSCQHVRWDILLFRIHFMMSFLFLVVMMSYSHVITCQTNKVLTNSLHNEQVYNGHSDILYFVKLDIVYVRNCVNETFMTSSPDLQHYNKVKCCLLRLYDGWHEKLGTSHVRSLHSLELLR